MKYMLQVRFNGADAAIGRLPADEQEKVTAEFEAVRRSPGVLDGNQLQAPGTAVTVRVADIHAAYRQWRDRGAEFLTPPADRGPELRCYMRDPDGHLIEVGQMIPR